MTYKILSKNYATHLIFCVSLWLTFVCFLYSGFFGGNYWWGGNVELDRGYPTAQKIISKPWAIIGFASLLFTIYVNPYVNLLRYNVHLNKAGE